MRLTGLVRIIECRRNVIGQLERLCRRYATRNAYKGESHRTNVWICPDEYCDFWYDSGRAYVQDGRPYFQSGRSYCPERRHLKKRNYLANPVCGRDLRVGSFINFLESIDLWEGGLVSLKGQGVLDLSDWLLDFAGPTGAWNAFKCDCEPMKDAVAKLFNELEVLLNEASNWRVSEFAAIR